jgi:hypothetical protein
MQHEYQKNNQLYTKASPKPRKTAADLKLILEKYLIRPIFLQMAKTHR